MAATYNRAMPTPTADLILDPTWILPIVPARTVLTGHSVAINDGKIIAIGATATIHEQFHATAIQRLDGQVLMPGLVNAHGHAAMVLLRGLAEDMPLDAWLRDRIWPIEAQWMSPDFVADGVALALLEMLKSGTTCFSDMYFFPEVAARAAQEAGMRAQIAFPLIQFPNAWSSNAADGFHKGLALHDEHRDDPLLRVAFGPALRLRARQSRSAQGADLRRRDRRAHSHAPSRNGRRSRSGSPRTRYQPHSLPRRTRSAGAASAGGASDAGRRRQNSNCWPSPACARCIARSRT